ncbi:hypothetical protein SFC79_20915 [Nocardioides sp. S-58]|uniref:Exo-alpha-sialidase n=1 Tax=Nocardioides renjunii TaxID=3095075 RepID=A0ABU5KHX6_9ACTN|nr:hypothetical protein [Nocardioides sp. S-58]MDZ5664250.1 hypothetical protein [Nocardioides sp. S-58]
MSLPTDLVQHVAERAEPPGFDAVLARAGRARRRRRTTVASALAAAVVVGGVALGAGGWLDPDRQSPDPAPPVPTETWDGAPEVDARLPEDVREVLGEDRVHPWAVAGSEGGGVAALWRGCPDDAAADRQCRSALVTRLGDDVRGSVLAGDSPTLAEVPGGWLVGDDSGLFRVSADGVRDPVVDPGGSAVPVEPGDAVVPTPGGLRLLRGTKLLPLPSPGGGEVLAAYATPAGDLVVAVPFGTGAVELRWNDGGPIWFQGRVARPGAGAVSGAAMAGHQDGVAVVLLGDAPDGSVPVLEVASSPDAGRTWQRARSSGDLRDLSGLAVSDVGSTYLTTGSHGALRVGAAGEVSAVQQSPQDHSVFLASDRVCLVAEAGEVDVLRCSLDDGASWSSQALPGFR